ncbi:MAG TPA: glycine--tRNA ligase [Tepidisphaeraceae bacterium]|jgi:glycyl-tRNA synthetase
MADTTPPVMEQIVALAKRRGFIYPASDIYGGIRGFWDYGPLGVLLKNNIRDHWWNWMVECPPIGPDGEIVEMVGLDSAIIQHPKTWEASGHTATFADPMRRCTKCGHIVRADHYWDILATQSKWFAELIEATENFVKTDPETLIRWAKNKAKKSAPNLAAVTKTAIAAPTAVDVQSLVHALADGQEPCILCGAPLGPPEQFNLMMVSYAGTQQTAENLVYLRPETAQGIFLNFKNIVDTSRVKVPFGVAQIGKSFRNELTPRNFIFRSREFEQMEMEFFCPPDDALKWYAFWKEERMKWWLSLGVEPSRLRFRDHDADELSHYSKATVDIEYKYPFTDPDYGELEGIAHRGSFDLTQHQTHSGQKLDYFDQELQLRLKEQGVSAEEIKQRSRYIPNVIEPASGLTRAVLVLLCEAFTLDANRPSGMYLKFKPKFAPIKLGIFPLVAKDGMPEKARNLYMELRGRFACEFDVKQSIGKRYARMDEIGTPFCCTIDGDTMTSDVVTIRDRDTLAQEKVNITQVGQYVQSRL